MPSQLIKNEHISFMCAKNFTYAGEDYKLGEDFPEEKAVAHIETLVRARYLYAVVDERENKPRHWHHHVWVREDISKKLGILKNPNAKNITGESLYNKPVQIVMDFSPQDPKLLTEWEETPDAAAAIHNEMEQNIYTELVLQQENDEIEEPDEDEETEPDILVAPAEHDDEVIVDLENDERVIEEDDLYDPAEHNAPEVLDYLTSDITDEERERVLAAERNGRKRKGILNV